MDVRDYRDLIVWQKAFQLTLAIYKATANFPADEKYGIVAQLRRAGVSIPSNIAEGQGRHFTAEFIHHLYIARGSLKEVETQILISASLEYIKQDQADNLLSLTTEVCRLINGLSRSLRPLTTSH